MTHNDNQDRYVCTNCGSPFINKSFFLASGTLCPTCRQTKAIEDQHDFNRRQQERFNDQRLEEIAAGRRAVERAAAQQAAIAAQQAADARRNAAIAAEANITEHQAYLYGREYLDTHYQTGNPLEVKFYVSETGLLKMYGEDPYYLQNLNNAFVKGIFERKDECLKDGNLGIIEQQAFLAGEQVVQGKLSSSFCLRTGTDVFGKEVFTKTVDCNIRSKIDEETGELLIKYKSPFKTPHLNDSFKRGVNKALEEVNSEEYKKYRLEHDVADAKLEREITQQKKIHNTLLTAMLYTYPLWGSILVWFLTSGVITAICIIFGLPIMFFPLYNAVERWRQENREYIDRY